MLSRLANLWYWLRSSFWFLPSLMVLAAGLLALALLHLDESLLTRADAAHWWAYRGGPEGARAILSTIASSMITVAGVVFSITVVVLSLASSQFGPRLIRNFMDDRASQVVLGTFVAAYVYCLLVLRSFGDQREALFTPYLSVHGGLLLALAGIGVLIFFIHRISSSIQANHVVAKVCRQLDQAIRRLYPEALGEGDPEAEEDDVRQPDRDAWQTAQICQAAASGYFQRLDGDGLLEFARKHDALVWLEVRPGDFITRGVELARIQAPCRIPEDEVRRLAGLFILGAERTTEQDLEYAVSQLVEIAVRALSPGVNDPFTAKTCIDWTGVALATLADRKMPSAVRRDADGRPRIAAKTFTFAGFADAALNQIRQHAASDVAVSIRLLEMLAAIGPTVRRSADRRELLRHARMIHGASRRSRQEPYDIECLGAAYHKALGALGAGGTS